MPDERTPSGLPPDLPPEYAEAYRRGYERAYRKAAGHGEDPADDPSPVVDPDPLVDPDPVVEPVETASRPRHLALPPLDPDPVIEQSPVLEPSPGVEASPVVEPVEPAHPDPLTDPDPLVESFTISGPLFADEAGETDGAAGAAGAGGAGGADDAEPTQVLAVGDPGLPTAPPPAPVSPSDPAVPPAGSDSGRHRWDAAEEPDHHAAAYGAAPPEDGPDDGPDAAGYDHVEAGQERRGRPGWFVPALLACAVLLLVLSAYGIGRVFSSSVEDADVTAEEPDGVVLGEATQDAQGKKDDGKGDGKDPRAGKPEQVKKPKAAYRGRTDQAPIGGAAASCQAPASVDAAGNRVGYPPANAYDGDLSTAWRCTGGGVGQTLTLTLAEAGEVGEVGLVPGYAKTDPRSGVDRYAENNRITRVRWTLADGTSFVQRFDGAASNRGLQSMRIPATDADTVTVEVLATTKGPRNTTAVSEVRIGRTVE